MASGNYLTTASASLERAMSDSKVTGSSLGSKYNEVRKELTRTGRAINAILDARGDGGDRVRCRPPPSAAGILFYRSDTRRILVAWGKAYEKHKETKLEIFLLGGKLERDESPVEAAVREFNEETAGVIRHKRFWKNFVEEPHPAIEIPHSAYTLFVEDVAIIPGINPDAIPDLFLKSVQRMRSEGRPPKEDVALRLEWVSVPDQRSLRTGPWSYFAKSVLGLAGLRRYLNRIWNRSVLKMNHPSSGKTIATMTEAKTAPVADSKSDEPIKGFRQLDGVEGAELTGDTLMIRARLAKSEMIQPSVIVLRHAPWGDIIEKIKVVKLTGFLIDSSLLIGWLIENKISVELSGGSYVDSLMSELSRLEKSGLKISTPLAVHKHPREQ